MNFLSKVKAHNQYDYVTNDLYNSDNEPITKIDGSTLLLLSNGTSWEMIDGSWQQIEQELDVKINYGFYPFLLSICDQIHNHFVTIPYSVSYKECIFEKDEDTIKLTNIGSDEKIYVEKCDFVYLRTIAGNYLTMVTDVTVDDDDNKTAFSVDNTGIGIRVTGEKELVDCCFVSFPMGFLDVVAGLFAFDLFERDGKDLKVERLGNYSITNGDTATFYGDGNYPKQLLEKIKYWQRIAI